LGGSLLRQAFGRWYSGTWAAGTGLAAAGPAETVRGWGQNGETAKF